MNLKITWLSGIATILCVVSFADLANNNGIPQARAKLKTAKERLSTKASDQQRVNNCKVPVEKQGNKKRPNRCNKTDSKSKEG